MSAASSTSFAERLHLARVTSGLSQITLAERAGMSQQQLSRYEIGAVTPRTRVMMNLAACLGVRRHWLASGEEPQREAPPEPGIQRPSLITKILPGGETNITFVLSPDLRQALADRARSEGLAIDELLVSTLLKLAHRREVNDQG